MATKLKVIKTKAFKVGDADHKHYSVAYKGRIFGVNTLRFSEESEDALEVSEDGKVITINCDCELKRDVVTDQITGEHQEFIGIVPKLDLVISDI